MRVAEPIAEEKPVPAASGRETAV